MATVLVLLASGCEELEAVTVINLLRRAKITVVAAGLDKRVQPVRCSRGTVLVPDRALNEVMDIDFDMVVLPGGQPGTDNLRKDERVRTLLRKMQQAGKFIAAICAAPMVLGEAGVLAGKKATSFPGCLEGLHLADVSLSAESVVRDGRVITSRGPGTAMDFALVLVEALAGRQVRDQVEKGLVRA